jgi:hypothetical protein
MDFDWLKARIEREANLEKVLADSASSLCEGFLADRLTVYRAVDDGAALVAIFQMGLESFGSVKVRLDSNRSVAGYVGANRRLVNIRDGYDDEELAPLALAHKMFRAIDERTGYRTTQILAAPVVSQGKAARRRRAPQSHRRPAIPEVEREGPSPHCARSSPRRSPRRRRPPSPDSPRRMTAAARRPPPLAPEWIPFEIAFEHTHLWRWVILSVLAATSWRSCSFGAPSGGSREGRAMWGSLQVMLQRRSSSASPPPPPAGAERTDSRRAVRLPLSREARPEPSPVEQLSAVARPASGARDRCRRSLRW